MFGNALFFVSGRTKNEEGSKYVLLLPDSIFRAPYDACHSLLEATTNIRISKGNIGFRGQIMAKNICSKPPRDFSV